MRFNKHFRTDRICHKSLLSSHSIAHPLIMEKMLKKFIQNATRVAPKISKKGELFELRNGLVSQYPQTRKDAIKKTIQQMTLGKDVSSLFPDILKNIATSDVEQKKLVYLYVMNYAETHPELCILAVNTFVSDAQDTNPLIRCMAIRTMSMIRVDKILEYVEIPLRKTLQDDNPYVRKTAVICVAKLFALNKELCQELGVLEDLISALEDSNPMVVANAIAALSDIYEADESVVPLPKLIQSHVSQFLLALNECTEWARIIILGALAEYTAKDSLEAQEIIDRVTPHLQHVNAAVVLASIKVVIKNLPQVQANTESPIFSKLASALVSLMSTPPEMQYVALRNIRIVLEKYPHILSRELRIFYVKFNDPLYVKLEKIDTLVRLVDPSNLKQCTLLLAELKEYAMEFEPEFVSRAILALSQLGVKYSEPKFITKVLEIIIELCNTRDSFQDDCLVAMCNLLRHAGPNQEGMVTQVCSLAEAWSSVENLLQTDYAKCNYIWLLGQYPKKFNSIERKLQAFIDSFTQEESLTQMSLLISVVKLHSIIPGSMLQNLLELATTSTDEIDVRDMAIMYWRCLSVESSHDGLINELCSSSLPEIATTLDTFSPELLETLLKELSLLSSVYFKPVATMTKPKTSSGSLLKGKQLDELQFMAQDEILKNMNEDNLLDFDNDWSSAPHSDYKSEAQGSTVDDLNDIFGLSSPAPPVENSMAELSLNKKDEKQKSSNTQDLLDLF
ncbi:LAQU0S01e12288g1_1 [Lachancea quebecensis]|uniref:AP complex subunit beta n=1 Tax=Lachancea quebecensis TaxID=1654605 RepID=A0A0P1KMP9_9SACH|nr:LAQU0S01e12288g1_1 [Lachancea quebecensis]